jgi:hypothetical protein
MEVHVFFRSKLPTKPMLARRGSQPFLGRGQMIAWPPLDGDDVLRRAATSVAR